MIATEQQVRMAAQLYQARDAVRRLLGASYPARMAELGAGLQRLATARNSSVLKEAISAARAVSGMDSLLILAAAVEHAEPTTEGATA
jgi:hypothetical protein